MCIHYWVFISYYQRIENTYHLHVAQPYFVGMFFMTAPSFGDKSPVDGVVDCT